jgi:hypothetical protein
MSLAAAEYLVALARDGVDMPARRSLLHPDELTRTLVQVVLMRGPNAAVRERLRPDPAYWKNVETSELYAAIALQAAAVEPDRARFVDELARALLSER